jgi:hypothetical protein
VNLEQWEAYRKQQQEIWESMKLMSNQNEWETIEQTMQTGRIDVFESGCICTSHLMMDGYEYRLQRRKKEKVMPEICRKDALHIQHDFCRECVWVSYSDLESSWVVNDKGLEFKVKKDCILVIYRNGQEIWRRGE